MKRTVVCHFYNEEFLLPWWLKHHRTVFDHGIMIDYASTDSSRELIREFCPNWEVRDSRNEFFDSTPIDEEVMDIEKEISGWRMALNVTEFLYGNYDHLADTDEPSQCFLGNYMFVDMEDAEKGPLSVSHDYPLYQQRYWGYQIHDRACGDVTVNGAMNRMARSIHNHPVEYLPGRHFSNTKRSFEDLFIFYYGYASICQQGLNRKAQIQTRILEKTTAHHFDKGEFLKQYRNDLRPRCTDVRDEIAPLIDHHVRITGSEW